MPGGPDDDLLRFLTTQKTLVLATANPLPWPAPVYFVYQQQRFYFFSSAHSRHITAAKESGCCAAAIFRDSDNWHNIEGLQMDGRLERIQIGVEAMRAFSGYLHKFPTAKDFFVDAVIDFSQFIQRFRTQLYAFVPEHVFYLNNQAGLDKRQPIQLPD